MLLNVEHLYKYFNGQALLKDINFTVEDREAVGLIGINGCGKSTLLNIITGSEGYDKTPEGLGSVNIAGKASIGFLRQNSGLNSELTIGEEMKNAFAPLLETLDKMKVLEKKMADGGDIDSISHEYAELSSYFEARDGYRIDVKIKQVLNGMGFGSTPTDRVISTLSGGEKTRLALAKLLLEEPNLLILDEPTNHLDFETLMWLEDYLKGYKGAIIIVSHDRYFLNKVCTRICEIEQGRLTSYRGDYSSYLVQKKMNSERQLKEYEAQQKEIAKLEDSYNNSIPFPDAMKAVEERISLIYGIGNKVTDPIKETPDNTDSNHNSFDHPANNNSDDPDENVITTTAKPQDGEVTTTKKKEDKKKTTTTTAIDRPEETKSTTTTSTASTTTNNDKPYYTVTETEPIVQPGPTTTTTTTKATETTTQPTEATEPTTEPTEGPSDE